jgi:hypothetical protein
MAESTEHHVLLRARYSIPINSLVQKAILMIEPALGQLPRSVFVYKVELMMMKGHSIDPSTTCNIDNIEDQNLAPNSTVSDLIKVSSKSTSGWI